MSVAIDVEIPERAYRLVNEAINGVVFDGRHRLAPVYIDLEGEIADEVAARLDVPPETCLKVIASAVARTLKWQNSNPFSWHLTELEAWESLDRFEPPPFTALLACLSMAAERMHADEAYSEQNYYERLFEVLGVDVDGRKNSLKQNAKSTKCFWEALNRWLAENDYDFGRPTAKRVNKWPYVSFALSQAMLRKGDRARLCSLFAEYGLAPHERITDAEMSLYLHEWMRGSGPSKWLKRVWASPDLRDRVAAAACAELEVWDGQDEDSEKGRQRRRLSWAASLQVFPKRELRMFLTAAGPGAGDQQHLSLPNDTRPAAQAAFERCNEGLWLTPTSTGEFSVLEPVCDIALSPLMLASFELESDQGISFNKVARPIVPLIKLDSGTFYREVSRVSFLRPHLVLCHTMWDERVHTLLTRNARQGFVRHASDSLRGLPTDWVLFTGVEILRLPSSADANMQALVPLSEGVSVEMTGGLRLSQNLWHAAAPPEITTAANEGPLTLSLSDARGQIVAENTKNSSSCRLMLSHKPSWDAADFLLTVSSAGRIRSETHLSLRSADHPRRLPESTQIPAYSFSSGNPLGFFAAKTGHEASPISVQGMTTNGLIGEMLSTAGTESANFVPPASPQEEMPVELEQDYQLDVVTGLQETCVLRGYHYWLCEPFEAGEDPRDDKWMSCKSCRNRVLTRNRGANSKARAPKGLQRNPSMRPSPGMGARESNAPDPDLIMDALCYLGSGSWQKLQDLASSNGYSLLEIQRLCSALMALGHVDISYDAGLRNPISWTITPPSLVFASDGTAFLSGFRNAALLRSVSDKLGKIGATLETVRQEYAPTAYVWAGISPETANVALANVSDPHGRKLAFPQRFGAVVSSNAPDVSRLIAFLPAVHLAETRDLQRFDLGSGSWRSTAKIEIGGAYRADYAGRRYFYCTSTGLQREGSFSLVKTLAARAAGVRLHGYDRSQKIFKAVLGCEPPGLFLRALVANSGLMPERDGQQLLFSGVPSDVADRILSKLYG
jgi:hypothetical protein